MSGSKRHALTLLALALSLVAVTACGRSADSGVATPTTSGAARTPGSLDSEQPEPQATGAAVTPTPTRPPSTFQADTEQAYEDFGQRDRPLLRQARAASSLPASIEVPPLEDRNVMLVPTSAKLRFIQNTLYPELSLGDPSGRVTAYLVYGYTRGEDLGFKVANLPFVATSTQEVIATTRLYVEVDGVLYLEDELRGIGGAGQDRESDLVPAAVELTPSLGSVGEAAEPVVERILDAATGGIPSGQVADEDVISLLKPALGSSHWPDRKRAASNLPGAAYREDAAELLVRTLADSESQVADAASQGLAELADQDEEAAATGFARQLASGSRYVRDLIAPGHVSGATRELPFLEAVRDRTVPELVALLRDDDWKVRTAAAWALGEMGEEGAEAAPDLLAALSDEDPWVRQAAAVALSRTGDDGTGVAAPALGAVLGDAGELSDVRSAAAFALAILAEGARDQLPIVLAAYEDEDPRVRAAALSPLLRLHPADSESILLGAMGDPSYVVRSGAANRMSMLEPSPEVVASLVRALDDEVWSVRQGAAWSLGMLHERSEESVGPLMQMLIEAPDEDPLSIEWIITALQAVTGEDLGEEPADWLAWWQAQGGDVG